MKRDKRVTKREKKAMVKFINEMKAQQPPAESVTPKKTRKVKAIFSLKTYLAKKAQKRADKLTFREERREAKLHEGHNH